MRRVIIVTYHEVEDDVADELHMSMNHSGDDAIAEFIQANPPTTINISSSLIQPHRG
jgi:hypothetical protein